MLVSARRLCFLPRCAPVLPDFVQIEIGVFSDPHRNGTLTEGRGRRGFKGQLLVRLARDLIHAKSRVWNLRGRIKKPKTDSCDKEAPHTLVDFLFSNKTFLHGVAQSKIFIAAGEVGSTLDRFSGGFGHGGGTWWPLNMSLTAPQSLTT